VPQIRVDANTGGEDEDAGRKSHDIETGFSWPATAAFGCSLAVASPMRDTRVSSSFDRGRA
jgi:hypothetical protein